MKIAKCFYLVVLILVAEFSAGQNLECSKFRNGMFRISDDETMISIINRIGERQTEISGDRTDSTVYKVIWIDDCSYKLIPMAETFSIFPSLPDSAMLLVEIIETKIESYIQVTTSNFSDLRQVNEVIRIQR